MKIEEFEKELKAISADLEIRPHPKFSEIANVFFQGVELFPIPNFNIYDKRHDQYAWETPNGERVPHRSRIEALEMANSLVKRMTDDMDFSDAMRGEGEYSDSELLINNHAPTNVIDLRPLELKDDETKNLLN